MKDGKVDFRKFYIYRYRYWIGYGLVGIGLIAALIFAGIYLPGGLSKYEIQSVINSNSISVYPVTSDMINLPYHMLQKLSFHLFGVSILSIKLPSIILAFLSVIGMVLLLRQWFKPSIAVLASLIAITTGQFLFIAQSGTPDIMYLFWPVWIIMFASFLPTQKKFRLLTTLAFFAVMGLSLYTPLSIYVLIVMVIAIIIHPHLRYIIKQLSKVELLLGLIVLLLISTPLILAVINTPHMGLTLLGIPNKWPNLYANILSLGNQYFGFANPIDKLVITPFFELGSSLLILIGIYYVLQAKETSKNYLLVLWLICLLPVLILRPEYLGITFLPLTLLLASGLNGLLAHWYEMFPNNPYARIGGLIPIVILVSVLVFSGVNRYVYGYRYDPVIVNNFSKDLQLLPKGEKNLLVSKNETSLYEVVKRYDKTLKLINQPTDNSFLVSREAKQQFNGYKIDRIITTSKQKNSDRFYLYKKIVK